jgi:hypothetical protein
MESCIPLRKGLNKMATNSAAEKQNANADKSLLNNGEAIRLKGQMKYIPSWHKLAFLCHPM